MVRVANLSENLLTLVDVTEKNEVVDRGISNKITNILAKSQDSTKLSKSKKN